MHPLKILAYLSLGLIIIQKSHSTSFEDEPGTSLDLKRKNPPIAESHMLSPQPLGPSFSIARAPLGRKRVLGSGVPQESFNPLHVSTGQEAVLLCGNSDGLNDLGGSLVPTTSSMQDTREMRTPSPEPVRPLPPIARLPFKGEIPGLAELESLIDSSDTLNNTQIIWDLDGVLTLDSNPDPNNPLIRPNIRAINLFREAVRKGALCIIASAWNNFDETLSKVRALGLADLAGIEGNEPVHVGGLDPKIFPRVYYHRKGIVVSARYQCTDIGNKKGKLPHFSQKAFTPSCLEHDKKRHGEPFSSNTRENTVFVEDNSINIKQFDLDRAHCLNEYGVNILGNGNVTYFLLAASSS